MPNRLAYEKSLYLRQHADNPVDWYPWGEEAFRKARQEDKPIFLSIGYSACHWCHVMAHESFEDPKVAQILNEHFVSVKVDREERPDVDRVYMNAVFAMTGHGGWPLSVFLTPDGEPFYGGTYFPPTPRYGLPSFSQILIAISRAWREDRQTLLTSGRQVVDALRRAGQGLQSLSADAAVSEDLLDAAVEQLDRAYDPTFGGWGGRPKFPHAMVIEFLLARAALTGDERARRMAEETLTAMARGGMYDQIGGGFHRYAVDERWLIPHFEKMLYDNAQLARAYLHGWQVTGDPLFGAVARETLDYVLREMTDPGGGIYATQDADSEGEEGKFFVWRPAEIRLFLGDEAEPFMRVYGVTEAGNFEGRNVLSLQGTWEERETLEDARRRLFQARERRVRPARDEKVIAAWNGLMLAAMAEAGVLLQDNRYLDAARKNARFLLTELAVGDDGIAHAWQDGAVTGPGYLDDYACVIEGLLSLYQATFEDRWLSDARRLASGMVRRFKAPVGFYDTCDEHESLIIRAQELADSAVPSGNSMAATVLLKLGELYGDPDLIERANASLERMASLLQQQPLSFGQWLWAAQLALAPLTTVAVVGDPMAPDARALVAAVRERFRPHVLLTAGTESAEAPVLRDKKMVDGRAAAYVCRGYTCLAPVTEPRKLSELLDRP